MSKQEKFIMNRIQNNKPNCRNYAQGTEVYYEGLGPNNIQKGTVAASGVETTMLSNGNWCYNWQLVAVSEIPTVARM